MNDINNLYSEKFIITNIRIKNKLIRFFSQNETVI